MRIRVRSDRLFRYPICDFDPRGPLKCRFGLYTLSDSLDEVPQKDRSFQFSPPIRPILESVRIPTYESNELFAQTREIRFYPPLIGRAFLGRFPFVEIMNQIGVSFCGSASPSLAMAPSRICLNSQIGTRGSGSREM
jgi:hypothetical protein